MGWDYSGTIAAMGDKMKGKWKVGDEVWGMCEGPVSSHPKDRIMCANRIRPLKGHLQSISPYQIGRPLHGNRDHGPLLKQLLCRS